MWFLLNFSHKSLTHEYRYTRDCYLLSQYSIKREIVYSFSYSNPKLFSVLKILYWNRFRSYFHWFLMTTMSIALGGKGSKTAFSLSLSVSLSLCLSLSLSLCLSVSLSLSLRSLIFHSKYMIPLIKTTQSLEFLVRNTLVETRVCLHNESNILLMKCI